jgi:hypothetical protein
MTEHLDRFAVLLGTEEACLGIEDVDEILEELHARTGWDFSIELASSTHVVWNATIRVTPVPFDKGTSDRSYVVHRVGPPQQALQDALHGVLAWLGEVKPAPAAEACFACGDHPEGYHGTGGEMLTLSQNQLTVLRALDKLGAHEAGQAVQPKQVAVQTRRQEDAVKALLNKLYNLGLLGRIRPVHDEGPWSYWITTEGMAEARKAAP